MSHKPDPAPPQTATATAPAPSHLLAAVAIPNAITLALGIWNHWPLDALLWPYWLQLVIAGVFNNLRMRRAALLPIRASSREFVSAHAVGGKGDISDAGFFCVHYGMFTALAGAVTGALTALPGGQTFVVFVAAATFALLPRQPIKACLLPAALYYLGYLAVPNEQTWGILSCGASFAATQFYAYRKHLPVDIAMGRGLEDVLLFSPYVRLIPMYAFSALAILLAVRNLSDPRTLVVAFVAIKCVVEYLGYGLEQRMLKSIGLEEPA